MRGPQKENWMRLCALIAEERDPDRFSELTKQLLAELEEKDRQLKKAKKDDADKKTAGPDQEDRSSEDTSRP